MELGPLLRAGGFVSGTLTQEMIRGANVRRGMTGTDLFTAMIGLVSRNKRRYGGYIVHAGIVLIFLGFAGEGFSRDQQLLLKPGEEAKVGDYTIHLDALRVTDDGQKQMITGHITVKNADGEVIDQMRPAKWYFRKHEEEPTTEVAIRRSFAEDLYIVMPAFEIEEQTASVEVHINPLVNWVWFGFGILAIGTGIALLPEASMSFALAKLPAEAVTASLLLLSILLSSGAAFAQHVETGQDPRLQLTSPESRASRAQAGVLVRRVFAAAGGAMLVRALRDRAHRDRPDAEGRQDRGSECSRISSRVRRQPGSQRAAQQRLRPRGVGDADRRWRRRLPDRRVPGDALVAACRRFAGMPAGVEDPEMAARLDDELRNLD